MKVLGLFLVALALIFLIRRAFYRQSLKDSLTYDGNDGPLVEVEKDSGEVQDVSHLKGETHESWFPVRFPNRSASRIGGFSKAHGVNDVNLHGRRDWCETYCTGAWRVEGPKTAAPIFWFENEVDAKEFTFAWFPIKGI